MDDDIDFDNSAEDDEKIYRKAKFGRTSVAQPKPQKKASYESNADVQRWLKEQTVKEEDAAKPPFNPTFLASLRDAPWLLSSLSQFYELDLISDVLYAVKSGKEATVYCCVADPSVGVEYLAAKVYRPRMFRSLRNDAIYRQNRFQHDDKGKIIRHDQRSRDKKRSQRERVSQVSSWIEYEFQTQNLLYASGANVPRPLAQIGNAVLMEYIGDVDEPAPLLQEVSLSREEAQPLFECIIENIELCLAHDRIHGDLSEYNILYWQGAVTLIDFAQAVDPHHNSEVFTLFARDIQRVCRYFARHGVYADASELATDIWTRYMGHVL